MAQATDIVDLIGQYIALKRRGREFVGLCPFHDDSHPSLNVSPTKQIFKCFVCGAGGGVFQFLMLYERLSFPEAVRTLAERANIPLPRESAAQPAQPGLSKNDLVALATFAARYYRSQLHGPAGRAALEYARSRGLTDESIKRFGLGCAPQDWEALIRAARKKGFSQAQLIAAGLAVKRDGADGCYDRFRGRLMFPIIDPAGRVVGFGGRAMDQAERAKYINSPDSILFDKSSQLYALNWSRQDIVSTGQAVVVEGYLDALIPLQAGVVNIVATLGTALTERHVRLLSRYAREAVLVFDADAAGAAAAERALEIFLAQELHVRVATIPAGKDPCDFCLAEGGGALRALVDKAPDALQHVWDRRQEELRAAGDRLADRRQVVSDFLRVVVSSSMYGAIDDVRRGQLAQHIGHMLNVSPAALQQEMRRMARRIPRRSQVPAAEGDPVGPMQSSAARQVLEVLLNRPDLFDQVAERLDPKNFPESLGPVAERLWTLGRGGHLTLEDMLASEAMAELGSFLVDLATTGQRRGNHEQTLAHAVEHMLYCSGRQQMQDLRSSGYTGETLRRIQETAGSDVRRRPRIR